jgi:murein L,D-transpeptidase YafK
VHHSAINSTSQSPSLVIESKLSALRSTTALLVELEDEESETDIKNKKKIEIEEQRIDIFREKKKEREIYLYALNSKNYL